MSDLTNKQQKIYDQIVNLKKEFPMVNPTVAQLARLFTMSRQGMTDHIKAMEVKGYILRLRGIEVIR